MCIPIGIFSEPLGEKTSAWVKVGNTFRKEDSNWPDVQCHVITPHMAFDWGLLTSETVGLDRSVSHSYVPFQKQILHCDIVYIFVFFFMV